MKKPLWLAVWLLLIEIVIVLILIPGDYTGRVIERESELLEENLGREARVWVIDQANNWYQTSVLDSGIYSAAYDMLIPTEEERLNSKGMENLGQHWFAWIEGRIDALFNVVYQFYSRMALLASWAPYLLILLVPAVYDGMMTWRIKRTNFDYASPVVHRYSVRGTVLLATGLVIAFFAPIALNPLIIPAVLMCCCVLVGLAFGNLQKRV